jgi:PIN domain nuclease of toxin-antitoxin system
MRAARCSRARRMPSRSTTCLSERATSSDRPVLRHRSAYRLRSRGSRDVFHRDPAGRLIVAAARVANALLMTRDHRILDYAARGHLTAIPA